MRLKRTLHAPLTRCLPVQAAFLPSASSKVQLSREQQVEQLLSEAFYGCAGNCCDALHKLASRLCSGSSSESSGMSNKAMTPRALPLSV